MKRRFAAALAAAVALLLLIPAPAHAANTPETISWFREDAGKYYDETGHSSNHYAYTARELKMLAIVIHLEARGELYAAKLAVGDVVMNRVLSPGYPGETIAEVVTQPNQFCFDSSVRPTAECVRAARDVLDREKWVVPQDVYFFRATSSRSNWGSHAYYAHIGATAFYRGKYRGRLQNGPVPAALGERVYEWPQYGCVPGARVRKVQMMLGSLGYACGADGSFDGDTREAVARFQTAEGLEPTGVAEPATLGRLIARCRGRYPLGMPLATTSE